MSNRDLALIALFAALVTALGTLPPIPITALPVPIVLQNLGVMLAGAILGPRRGGFALLAFLGLVAAGAPVLSGGRGGLAIFAGPTAGFLLAWPISAWAVGTVTKFWWSRLNLLRAIAATALGGIPITYGCGILWLVLVGGVPLETAAWGSLIFLPADLLKAAAAGGIALAMKRAYPVLR